MRDRVIERGCGTNVNFTTVLNRNFLNKLVFNFILIGSGSLLLSACGNGKSSDDQISVSASQAISTTASSPVASTPPAAPMIIVPQVIMGQVVLFEVGNPDSNLTYTWNFGVHSQLVPYYMHGEPSGAGQPLGSVTQSYASSGSYPVSLTATNRAGLSTTSHAVISVNDSSISTDETNKHNAVSQNAAVLAPVVAQVAIVAAHKTVSGIKVTPTTVAHPVAQSAATRELRVVKAPSITQVNEQPKVQESVKTQDIVKTIEPVKVQSNLQPEVQLLKIQDTNKAQPKIAASHQSYSIIHKTVAPVVVIVPQADWTHLNSPQSIAVDRSKQLYVGDSNRDGQLATGQ